ncbi:MAG: Exodeoxyribonuclease I [Candidatus Erwinia impunctatus]
MKHATAPTFLFHDYETFGKSPSLDRPAQFAGLRTDADFNPLGDADIFYCYPADDYLPDPEAVMITGITPQITRERGSNEVVFSQEIHRLFTTPETCIVGYNNVRFDDEVTRNLFYRNFYDPYAWSWQQGNSRWDLLDVMRACYALRPDGIHWPINEEGLPSFRLEHLSKTNEIEHSQAHDAMADVYATIAMAKLVKEKQPRLYDFLFAHRHKNKIMTLIDIPGMTPLVHVSGMFGAQRGNTSWVAPVAWHPVNKNALISVDLAGDITPLLTLDADALREQLYTPRDQLGDKSPVPLKLIHINKCPVLAPANTLRPEDAQRLNIDRQHCLDNLRQLRANPQVRDKLVALYADAPPFTSADNVDAQLYDGFFSAADRSAMEVIQQTSPEHLPALTLTFNDPRIEKLLFRYRARNFPATLDKDEQRRWLNHRRSLFTADYLQQYIQQLEVLSTQHQANPDKLRQLQALFNYARQLVS